MIRQWMLRVATAGCLVLVAAPARAIDQKDVDAAVDKGVRALLKMQREDGTWPYSDIGSTSLAGLTLLECKMPPDDPAIQKAANAVRLAINRVDRTYDIALALLFLDRIGDDLDVPLLESLTVRLLSGQQRTGGWSYFCPSLPASEVARLSTRDPAAARRNPPPAREKEPEGKEGSGKGGRELPPEIKAQLVAIERAGPYPGNGAIPDNSNTQFAILALWVGHRHGLPVDRALDRVYQRFKESQNATDGGWGYYPMPPSPSQPLQGTLLSTPSMTCAGLLGLAAGHGSAAERAAARTNRPKATSDPGRDPAVRHALLYLGTWIGDPRSKFKGAGGPLTVPPAGGKDYYALWSLERVAMVFGLPTIGKKDWFAWGAEILVGNQQPGGTWEGTYGKLYGGADTCFALLFLVRSNLVQDLTSRLRGKTQDPGNATLKARNSQEVDRTAERVSPSAPKTDGEGSRPVKELPTVRPPALKDAPPRSDPPADPSPSSSRLADELVGAPGAKQNQLLEKLRNGKGVANTEALAAAIPRLSGDSKTRARDALAERLARMKLDTLADYLKDEDTEIRRAAALAVAVKEGKSLIPKLIDLLNDRENTVARAAHAALKELSGQSFGLKDVAEWKKWSETQKK